jgi:hypothetical protein
MGFRKEFFVRKDSLGRVIEFDGDRYAVQFRERSPPSAA